MRERKKEYIPTKIFGADITLAIGCKLDCRYCPQKKLINRYVELFGNEDIFMSFNTFRKCLEKIECGAGINIGGMVEPFHNKECSKMIKYAYDLGYKVSINTTLVGATEEDLEILKGVRFEYVKLHIPDQTGNSKFVITDEYLKILQKFSDLFIINDYSCHGEVHGSVKKYIKSGVRIASTMMNRAGNLEYEELQTHNHKGKIACGCGDTDRGWKPEILPNGTVVLCCMDYGMQHILGNLMEQDWSEILREKEFLMFEQGFEDDKIPCLCRKCSAAVPNNHHALEESKLLGQNAIKIARILENFAANSITEEELENKFSKNSVGIIKRLESAENICVFGLGKLFHDNYFQSLWHNVIKANMLSDNDEEKWGGMFGGISCVEPQTLKGIDNLLVITYVKNDTEIQKQLKEMGIANIINIYEIFGMFD